MVVKASHRSADHASDREARFGERGGREAPVAAHAFGFVSLMSDGYDTFICARRGSTNAVGAAGGEGNVGSRHQGRRRCSQVRLGRHRFTDARAAGPASTVARSSSFWPSAPGSFASAAARMAKCRRGGVSHEAERKAPRARFDAEPLFQR